MTKIVMFTGHTSSKIGGLEDFMAKLASARGGDILFVENDPGVVPETVKSFFDENGVTLHSTPVRTTAFEAAGDIYRILKKARPEIVHVNFQPVSYVAAVLAKLMGAKKVYWTKHNRLTVNRFSATWWYHVFAMLFVDRVICVSEAVAAELRRLGLGAGKRFVLPLGVDLARFNADDVGPDRKRELRMELGIEERDFVVAVVAQIRPEKRLNTFIRAMRILVHEKEMTNVKALIVGGVHGNKVSHRLEREYRELVESEGLSGNVLFLGVRDDVQLLYSISHLAGLSSTTEGLPLALVEAAAMGLPLFGSKAGGIPEIVVDNHNGLLFEPGRHEQLAELIRTIAIDKTLQQRFGERSRTLAAEKYDMDKCVGSLNRLYDPPLARFGR